LGEEANARNSKRGKKRAEGTVAEKIVSLGVISKGEIAKY